MFSITEADIQQLVNDPKALQTGRQLATDAKWLRLTRGERGIWGEAVGSGKNPYQTQIDTQLLAFKCNCPSRQFPCKHGIGLITLFANQPNLFKKATEEPDWVKEWLDKRVEATLVGATLLVAPTDPEAEKKAAQKAKTADARAQKVAEANLEMDLILRDWLRAGILTLTEQKTDYFEKIAARMVDFQANGLANAVRQFPKIGYPPNPIDRQSAFLMRIAQTFLRNEAFKNNDRAENPLLLNDLKTLIGYPQRGKELLENPAADRVIDTWLSLAAYTEQEDDITAQYQWLVGATTGRFALILDFAYKTAPLPPKLLVHRWHGLELVFFASVAPSRAVVAREIDVKNLKTDDFKPQLTVLSDWTAAHQHFVGQLKILPFLEEIPQIVDKLRLITDGKKWHLEDQHQNAMPLAATVTEDQILSILAATGGAAAPFFVLRSHDAVLPKTNFSPQFFKNLL